MHYWEHCIHHPNRRSFRTMSVMVTRIVNNRRTAVQARYTYRCFVIPSGLREFLASDKQPSMLPVLHCVILVQ